jgi:hypothetical protein
MQLLGRKAPQITKNKEISCLWLKNKCRAALLRGSGRRAQGLVGLIGLDAADRFQSRAGMDFRLR